MVLKSHQPKHCCQLIVFFSLDKRCQINNGNAARSSMLLDMLWRCHRRIATTNAACSMFLNFILMQVKGLQPAKHFPMLQVDFSIS